MNLCDSLVCLAAGTTTSKVIAGFLWSGLVLLTAAFIVILKTKWGQSRPITKCIGLSILAHVLLLAYAYGTNLIAIPSMDDQEVVKLKFRNEKQSDKKEKKPAKVEPTKPAPWEKLNDSEPPPVQKTPGPPRQATVTREPPRNKPAPRNIKPLMPNRMTKVPDDLGSGSPRQATTDSPPTSKIINPIRPAPPTKQPGTGSEPKDNGNQKKKQPSPKGQSSPGSSGDSTAQPSAPRQLGPVQAKQLNTNDPPAALPVPRDLPVVYRHRVAPRTAQWLRSRGGSRQTEDAVSLALAWLARNQSSNGRWDALRHGAGQERHVLGQERDEAGRKADTAMTGLAVLAFLGAGHTHKYGKHRQVVAGGIDYLKSVQKRNGSLAGSATLFARMYCHGIATFAMAEAYSMTKDEQLKPYVESAIRFTLAAQSQITGGWRYQIGDRGDMSQFGWQLLALKSAAEGGIPIPRRTRLLMLRFLRSVSFGRAGGLASYRPGRAKSRTMTAEALVCRQFLQTSNPSLANEAISYIREQLPSPTKQNFYYWYYATLALQRQGGPHWTAWNRSLKQSLVSTQSRGGNDDGSWSPQTRWGGYGGRVYTTAMAAMCLEVYYRFD